jgi:hypothetical protein
MATFLTNNTHLFKNLSTSRPPFLGGSSSSVNRNASVFFSNNKLVLFFGCINLGMVLSVHLLFVFNGSDSFFSFYCFPFFIGFLGIIKSFFIGFEAS